MQFAARITDRHSCSHGGGPILPAGCPSVLIGGKPAARKGDKGLCNSPTDTIVQGEPTVLVGDKQAARIGDATAHGGNVVQGEPTVWIGSSPQADCAREAARRRVMAVQQGPQPGAASDEVPAPRTGAPPAGPTGPTASGLDVNAAVQRLNGHALDRSIGRCAQYTRQAIEAGGVQLERHGSARDYGPSLEGAGFTAVADEGSFGSYAPAAGDVTVFQGVPGHPHGHMAMFNGERWVSDFRQRSMFVAPAYSAGSFRVYRP